MSFRKSIRWRIQSWHGALLLAMCAGLGVTAYRLEKSNALRRFDLDLETRLGALTSSLGKNSGPPGDRPPRDDPSRQGPRRPPGFQSPEIQSLFPKTSNGGFYYQVWTRRGEVMDRSSSAPSGIGLPAKDSGLEKLIRQRNGMREFYIFTPPGECILVGASTTAMERELGELAWKLGLTGAAVLAIGLAGGWWIATRALRPISDISLAAQRIAGGNLKERIRTGETGSELGQLAGLLNETFTRLDDAFEEQSRFTSDAAHELRTPVSVILAQSQLALKADRSAEDYREAIIVTRRSAQRMNDLIESLLQLAIIDSEKGKRNFSTVDLADIAVEQILLTAPLAAEKGITIRQDLASAKCLGDGDQIGRIAMNLLGNSVKFCPPGSNVHIMTTSQNGIACLSVSDNGPGIPANHLPHIFERFYRADASRNRASGGAGLGLAICKRIAESHGGSLTVESSEGSGSVFTLILPIGGA